MKWYEKMFKYIIYLSYFLYALVIFGLSQTAPEYLDYVKIFLKYFICLILIYRFNPFSSHRFTYFDKEIVFQSAVYLLSTTAITDYISLYFDNYKKDLSNLV
tara:strand:+ start:148 stop:453 length:306 start_codon:yes stop_codon:yes gene_type:complete